MGSVQLRNLHLEEDRARGKLDRTSLHAVQEMGTKARSGLRAWALQGWLWAGRRPCQGPVANHSAVRADSQRELRDIAARTFQPAARCMHVGESLAGALRSLHNGFHFADVQDEVQARSGKRCLRHE